MSVTVDVSARLTQVFENVFHDLPKAEALKLTRLDAKYWDSEVHLFLIVSIEEEFGISISDSESLELTSFASALEIILEKLPS